MLKYFKTKRQEKARILLYKLENKTPDEIVFEYTIRI